MRHATAVEASAPRIEKSATTVPMAKTVLSRDGTAIAFNASVTDRR
jgi:hypothetical protein